MASRAKRSDSREAVGRTAKVPEQDRLPDSTREDKIRRRAYEIYLERGREPGGDLEDWLQAERELTTGESRSGGNI